MIMLTVLYADLVYFPDINKYNQNEQYVAYNN